jgi:hypothetical protein
MDSSFGTLRCDPALSKISLGEKKLDHRVLDSFRASPNSQFWGARSIRKRSNFSSGLALLKKIREKTHKVVIGHVDE